MAYFPLFIDLEGKCCVVVGGGTVARRKVEVLLGFGPRVTVIAPKIQEEIRGMAKQWGENLRLLEREFLEGDLELAELVVAATGVEEVNRHISELCREKRIPVNVVDVKEECSFIFPALIREKDITVGISTGGSSPTIAQYLKKSFREAIPEGFGELAEQLGTYRELVKERVDSLPLRTEIFREMVTEGIRQGGTFTREQAEVMIDRKLEEDR